MTIADNEPLTAQNWPIAAAMINFPSVLPDGTTTQDQTAQGWAGTLEQVADAGFTELDPTDSWLRLADLSPERLREFSDVAKSVGLSIPATARSTSSTDTE
jgi:sugar phosphate isomerase/epimerase